MNGKFAKIEYAPKIEEIPLKYKLIEKSPGNHLDWYVKKYNPFTVSGMKIAGEWGYNVKLPITAYDAKENYDKTIQLLENTISALKDYNVEIILPPKNLPYVPREVRLADGISLYPFLLKRALYRLLGKSKALSGMDVVIMGKDSQSLRTAIENLCGETNFLTVLVRDEDANKYGLLADEIFKSTGLEIHVTKNPRAVKDGDIVINLWYEGADLAFLLKKGCIFFDLSGNIEALKEKIRKRGDVLFIDSWDIVYKGSQMTLQTFEMAFFLKNIHYRKLIRDGYEKESVEELNNFFQSSQIEIESFLRLNKAIPQGIINNFMRSIG